MPDFPTLLIPCPIAMVARKVFAYSQQSYEKEIGVDMCSIVNYFLSFLLEWKKKCKMT